MEMAGNRKQKKEKRNKRYTAKRSNACVFSVQEKEGSVNGQVKILSRKLHKQPDICLETPQLFLTVEDKGQREYIKSTR